MRLALFLIVTIWFVGCGKKTTPVEPETKAEPTPAEKAAAEKAAAEKAAAIKKVADEAQANAFVNTLGMKFVPVPGTDVQFCIWETRVKDYAAYAAANAGVDKRWKYPSFSGITFTQTDTHPVVNVSWNDAQAFCAWLTKKELAAGKIKAGQRYRLPTDAEWSVAVGLGREGGNTPEAKDGGVKNVYPWGKEWSPPKGAGNYADTTLKTEFGQIFKKETWRDLKVIKGYRDGIAYAGPVGSFAANKHGLHDLGGNVWEKCEDKWNATSARRVERGASWDNYDPDRLLSSDRANSDPGDRDHKVGFRCVLEGE